VERTRIRACEDAVVLGIILQSGTVIIVVGDAAEYPGHTQWIRSRVSLLRFAASVCSSDAGA